MTVAAKTYITPEEYLDHERAAECRSEYYNGEIFAMAGASREHSIIIFNLNGQLYAQLRGQSCEVYANEMRVDVSRKGLYTYPDIVVVCGDRYFKDDHADTLLNPTLLIEVLSPSTEAYDRGKKFEFYQTIESLLSYVLISQDRPRVEQYVRQENGSWLLTVTSGLDQIVELTSIGCRFALADLYERVQFPTHIPLREV